MPQILYRDEELLVCIKPVGVSSEQTDWQDEPVFPVHRLDQAVGGVMVFARTKAAAAELTAAIQSGAFEKEYLAVLSGVPQQEQAELEDLLFYDRSRKKSFVVQRKRSGVKEARLAYRVLQTAQDAQARRALVQVSLFTGRTHQIRVQFASRKLPLLGDGKYGGGDNRCTVGLWSHRLRFSFGGKAFSFSADPPEAFPWTLFEIPPC